MIPRNWSDEYQLEIFRELYAKLHRQLEEEDTSAHFIHIGDYEKEADEIIQYGGRVRNIGTGYRGLDSLLCGFDKGELIVVSGSTATGKTLFVLNCLINAYLNFSGKFTSLIFSLEMTNPQVTARIKQLLSADLVAEEMKNLPIFMYSSRTSPSISKMRHVMTECQKNHGLDLVIIDHLHYFSRVVDNQANEIGHLVREVKSLAMTFEVPIILVAHTRKRGVGESIDKEPSFDDLRDSSFIAQDADVVVMLKRDIMNPTLNSILNVFVAKNRNKGKVGTLVMNLEDYTYRLREE